MKGIFNLLDDECKMPKSSSMYFTDNVIKNWKGNKHVAIRKTGSAGFIIRHFAQDVVYNTVSFYQNKINNPFECIISPLLFVATC